MAEFDLIPESPLNGLRRTFEHIAVEEVSGRAVVSVAFSDRAGLEQAMRTNLDLTLPFVGNTARVETRDLLVLSLQSDQIFVLFPQTGYRPDLEIAEIAGDHGCVTDQSDGWALLRVSGPRSRAALERICMLDLHQDIFTVGAVARTVMEHLGVIIHRDDEHSFLLMSARSSAGSFAHSVVTSAENVS
ncbi:hypothetical protein AAFN47_12110 [Hoeflea sp. CAU 1731]